MSNESLEAYINICNIGCADNLSLGLSFQDKCDLYKNHYNLSLFHRIGELHCIHGPAWTEKNIHDLNERTLYLLRGDFCGGEEGFKKITANKLKCLLRYKTSFYKDQKTVYQLHFSQILKNNLFGKVIKDYKLVSRLYSYKEILQIYNNIWSDLHVKREELAKMYPSHSLKSLLESK